MEIERADKVGKPQDRPAVDRKQDVVYLKTCGFRRFSRVDVRDNYSPASGQTQARRQRWRDVLNARANGDATDMARLAKAAIVKVDDRRRNSEAQPFTASALAQHQRVNSDNVAIDIHQ